MDIIDKIIEDSDNDYYKERVETPEEREELLEYLKNKINLNLLKSFYQDEIDFSEQEYINLILILNYLEANSLNRAIYYAKYLYSNLKTEINDLDRHIKEYEFEDDMFCTFCRYNIKDLQDVFREDEAFLGMCIALRYKSNKTIEFLDKKGVRKPEKITQKNLKDVLKLWCNNKQECLEIYGDIRYWDVSNVTDMSDLFRKIKDFNSDISRWNVSNVTDMSFMFCKTDNFNSDISKWNVTNVTDMSYMFSKTDKFNSDISNWDVSNATDMSGMFFISKSFNSDISKWNTGNVTNMSDMFYYIEKFNPDISQWNVSNVTDMRYMFYNAKNFNGNISNWDVSKVTYISRIFDNCNIKEEYKPIFI